MLILLLVAFGIDQIQQATSEHFKSALKHLQSKLEFGHSKELILKHISSIHGKHYILH